MNKCFCGKPKEDNQIVCNECHSKHEIDDILGE